MRDAPKQAILPAINGADRLIEALLERGEIWDIAGPEGQAVQRDDEGRAVVPLLCSKHDADQLVQEVYEDDEPRRHDFDGTLDLLDRLVADGDWVDADVRLVDGEWTSYRVPAQELLDELLQTLGRSGKALGGQPQPQDVDRVRNLPSDERYDWFLRWVAIDEAAWALGDDSAFSTFRYDDGRQALILWPHAAFARKDAEEDGATELEAHRLPWPRLLEELDRAKEMNELVAVFPGPDEHSTVLEPDRLKADLEEARRAENDEGPA